MSKCSNCGNVNGPNSNFCRACGMQIVGQQVSSQPQSQPFDHSAPRPYAWKTDEYSTNNEARGQVASEPIGQPMAFRPPSGLANYRCPHCTSTYLPRHERKISTAGWITFAVLLVFFFPLFWIGFLIKEDTFVCPSCLKRIS